MTERTPAEIDAIKGLVQEFHRSIEHASVDRQTALDALEYTTWSLLIECFDDPESLDQYLAVMRERCLGFWHTRNQN